MYELNERVRFTYNAYDLITNEFLGTVDVSATIVRVWGKNVTLLTDSGKTFCRLANSPSISKA